MVIHSQQPNYWQLALIKIGLALTVKIQSATTGNGDLCAHANNELIFLDDMARWPSSNGNQKLTITRVSHANSFKQLFDCSVLLAANHGARLQRCLCWQSVRVR